MVGVSTTNLDKILTLTERMQAATFGKDQKQLLDVIYKNAQELKKQNALSMSMIGLSAKSHDLRQPLTAVVGYSALLNSPKLANHSELTEDQLKNIYHLHDLCRQFHWHLDNLILFSNYVVRPKGKKAQDGGMLDIRGYLLAQTENYVCRQRIEEVNVPEEIPFVYANDMNTKLMIRGLFAAAMDIGEKPKMQLSAYTMMKVVRAKLCIHGQVDKFNEIMKLVKVKEISNAPSPSAAATHAMIATISNVQMTSMLELGIYVATNLATEQGGRIKLEKDGQDLVFTLTMPTVPTNPIN